MPIDPSIYAAAQANVRPFNPLEMAGQAVGIGNSIQQNKLLQQGLLNAQAENPLIQANTANALSQNPQIEAHTAGALQENQIRQGVIDASSLIGKHTNPDGTIDYNALRSEASKNPSAVLGMNYLNQMTNDQNKLTSFVGPDGRTQNISTQSANAMLNPTSGNALQGADQAQQSQPSLSQDDVDNLHGHTDYMTDKIDSLLSKKSPLDLSDVLDMGSDMVGQFGKSGGKMGVSASGIATALSQLSPGADGVEPDDKSIRADLMSVRNKIQGAKSAITSKYGNPSSAQATPVAAQPASTVTPIMAGPAPGTVEEQTKRAGESQERMNQYRAESQSAPTVMSNLDNIIGLASKVDTGAGEGKLNDIKNALVSVGISNDKMKDDVSTFQQLQKYLAANVQFQGAGGANIPEIQALQAANPTDKQLPQTIKAVAQYAKAVQKGKILRETAMNQNPGIANNPAEEERFSNQWNANFDPSAVELSMLPPAEHEAFLKGKSDDQVAQIAKSYKAMKNLGAFQR